MSSHPITPICGCNTSPQPVPESWGDQPKVGYLAGDTIQITAYFTGDVATVNPDIGEQADYAGIYLLVEDAAPMSNG